MWEFMDLKFIAQAVSEKAEVWQFFIKLGL